MQAFVGASDVTGARQPAGELTARSFGMITLIASSGVVRA